MPHRIRVRRRSRGPGGFAVSAIGAGVALAALAGHHHPPAVGPPGKGAAAAIAYARAQLGKPYLWGGTGPGAFDCSGLAMRAYADAGIRLARRSQEQWATEVKVPGSRAEAGDLVFFAGADGTAAAPGHVGLVVDPARHLMIEAYATGFPVRYSTFGLASSPPGDRDPVGFTRPGAS